MKSNRNEPELEEVSSQVLISSTNDSLIQELEQVNKYNSTITEHAPFYKNFNPNMDILIRIYRRMPLVLDSGLIVSQPDVSDFTKATKIAGSGQQYAVQEKMAEFNFTTKAVIVALSKHYKDKYTVGQEVNIHKVPFESRKIMDTYYHLYQYQFVDPNLGTTMSPANCDDPNYGYALIPDSFITGWL